MSEAILSILIVILILWRIGWAQKKVENEMGKSLTGAKSFERDRREIRAFLGLRTEPYESPIKTEAYETEKGQDELSKENVKDWSEDFYESLLCPNCEGKRYKKMKDGSKFCEDCYYPYGSP